MLWPMRMRICILVSIIYSHCRFAICLAPTGSSLHRCNLSSSCIFRIGYAGRVESCVNQCSRFKHRIAVIVGWVLPQQPPTMTHKSTHNNRHEVHIVRTRNTKCDKEKYTSSTLGSVESPWNATNNKIICKIEEVRTTTRENTQRDDGKYKCSFFEVQLHEVLEKWWNHQEGST
jgi:hypothetical protein